MNEEKRIIRIIQEFCFKLNYILLISEFSLTIGPLVTQEIKKDNFTHKEFIKICNKRKDFFYANNLDINEFSKSLYRYLKKELSYYVFSTFDQSLLEYKRRMENGSAKGFPKEKTSEDTLRSDLSNYISYENFCEPRCASGNCDIIIPEKKTIVETKLWNGVENYNSGFPELKEYLQRQGYSKGYYVVFDYTKTDNEIIKNQGEYFKTEDGIVVIFIKMNRTTPSQIYKELKKKEVLI